MTDIATPCVMGRGRGTRRRKTASDIVILARTELAVSSGGDVHSARERRKRHAWRAASSRRSRRLRGGLARAVPRPGRTPPPRAASTLRHSIATAPAPPPADGSANEHVTRAGQSESCPDFLVWIYGRTFSFSLRSRDSLGGTRKALV